MIETTRLENLQKQFSNMSNEELLTYVTNLRGDRMKSSHQEKQTKKKQKSIVEKLAVSLADMDPETLKKLLS